MIRKTKLLKLICLLVLMICFGMMCAGNNAEAASPYKIRINKQQNCVTIYKVNDKGNYEPYKAMVCSVGWGTPIGKFSLKEKIRWHELDGPVYGQYCTRITGHILFHSVWYAVNENPATLSCTQFNKLGQVASHGCVRLCVADSKWIYNNVPFGTPVEIYNSKNPGPLGKPEMIKVPGKWGWDPTDVTNPKNPYNKKKPSIKKAKGKKGKATIKFAQDIEILDTITAKNTTGFDAKKRVTYTIKYKEAPGAKARKVKKFSTRKAGIYIITFKLTDEIGRKASLKRTYKVVPQIFMQKMVLNKTSKTLYLGGNGEYASFKLKMASFKPASTSITDVRFVSTNPAVATVDEKGRVTAVSPGNANIFVKSKDGSGVKEYCMVTVRRYADSLQVAADAPTLDKGQQTQVRTTLLPVGATGKSSIAYYYASSNPAVATVDANGVVTALSPGQTIITITVANAAQNTNIAGQVVITVNPEKIPDKPQDVSPAAITVK